MNTETVSRCPKCQASVPPEAPQGLCPKCLLAWAAAPTETGLRAEMPPAPSVEAVAARFSHLDILEFIGQGGMGFVYKARQPKLDRLVALKLLPQTAGGDPAFGERFNREARVLARLSHPNIVAVHDFGQAGDYYYLVMEFVDGVNLRQAMRAGRFTPEQAMALVPKICDALQYAHEEGVLHRDIKPENLLLDTRGRIKMVDFGIAKLQGEGCNFTLTASGAAVGTPHYMAPEQLEHPQDVDQRADIYSLGVVFYEMLTGELPLGRFAPPSEKSKADPRVDEVVLRTLEKERERRYQSAGEVKTQVENITAHPTPPGSGSAANPGLRPMPSGGARWSRRAIAGAGLVALSLYLMLIVVMRGPVQGEPLAIRVVLVGIPASVGTLLGYVAAQAIRAAKGQLRGGGLALFAAAAWLFLILDWMLFLVLVLATLKLFGPVSETTALVEGAGVLGLNGLIAWWWGKQRSRAQAQTPTNADNHAARRLPRSWLWASAAVLLPLVLILAARPRHYYPALTRTPAVPAPPLAPPGYEVGTGSSPGIEQQYQSTLLVPAGYALTVTATLSSNQVVLSRGDASASGFVIAPAGLSANANLTWKLLANSTLADGAPLEFSLGLTQEGERPRVAFNLIPPEPISIDWVSEPAQLWPPPNGLTKFLLLRGTASGVEWTVGVETRLDPLPAGFAARETQVWAGTNWMLAGAREPAAGALEPAAPPPILNPP